MGLEEHLLHMFRDDFEFNDSVGPSHLGSEGEGARAQDTSSGHQADDGAVVWAFEAEKELKRFHFLSEERLAEIQRDLPLSTDLPLSK